MKLCRVCGMNLTLDCFHKDRADPSGLHSTCKACRCVHAKYKARERRGSRNANEFYADSREGRRQKVWQSLLNNVPVFTRGNLSPRVCWELAA